MARYMVSKKDFDSTFYRKKYSDLQQFDDDELYSHWINFGKNEGRIASSETDCLNDDKVELIYSSDNEKIESIKNSGLFDLYFYSQEEEGVVEEEIKDFLINQYKQPSFLFDPIFYLEYNQDLKSQDINSLCHFIEFGCKEKRKPSPYVDMEYLESQVGRVSESENILSYFYRNEISKKLSVNPYFDVDFYLDKNPDVAQCGISPFEHFLYTGVYEGRWPRVDINIREYIDNYDLADNDINPFLHFIEFNGREYLSSKNKDNLDGNITSESNCSAVDYRQKGDGYEEPKYLDKNAPKPKVKALAYYLPQFHPFAENDEWWGQGFTEWTNTTRGKSRFNTHYQPHLPKHLGYYDLRVKETMIEQVRYAKAAGVHGFCFYHYWFNGKRIMEKPVNMLLDNEDIDIPFCIMWANENWTRTWDGLENDVLIAQDYLEEDDVPFIEDLGRHFKDKRYIRVDGRPLFFIYRPGIIPNSKKTIQKWRDLCKDLLNEEPLFYMAQAFDNTDPYEFGMDGAIEFPPHKIAAGLGDRSRVLGGVEKDFSGHYPSYDDLVSSSLKEVAHDYPLIRGVTPTWDNEARKPGRGFGFIGSTPKKYENWLRSINSYALENPISGNESFVVINAWNEWAEGAHLEPDVYWGAAYLNATYEAMHDTKKNDGKMKVILVGHDAHQHGAQLLTLNIFKTLKESFGIDVACILLEGGSLLGSYNEIGTTYVTYGSQEKLHKVISNLSDDGYCHAICNTTVTGLCTEMLAESNVNVISLIHELETLISEYSLDEHAKKISENASKVIFASKFVQDSFERVSGSIRNKAIIKPQGIYQTLECTDDASGKLKRKLGLKPDAKVVVNSGYADLRKGFDLFIQIAREAVRRDSNYHFVWLGNVEPSLNNWILKDIQNTQLEKHIHIVPFTSEISLYLEGANVFAMTSREDPFPSVVLESLALGTPVVGFEGGGGFVDALNRSHFGTVVSMADCSAFVDAIEYQIENDNKKSVEERKVVAVDTYDWRDYVFSLLEYLNPELKRVSVVVPNYNYERYIADRLTSIFEQSYPVYEIIVLDDKSSDNSMEIIQSTASAYHRNIDLVVNECNSGSVFRQWEKGTRLSHGEFLWIAEADDLASPNFLSTIMSGDTDFTVAYTDSKQIDENNKHLADDYRYYYNEDMITVLDKPMIYSGQKIIESCLSVRNQFMNVSSMVFRNEQLLDFFNTHLDYLSKFKVAGDWYVYVQLLNAEGAKCKLVSNNLNVHRRHNSSVTHKNLEIQLKEISEIQSLVRESSNLSDIVIKQEQYIKELNHYIKVRKDDE